jgi:translation initiation factor 3 subunit D
MSHQTLGIQTERPDQLASQLTLDIHNAWGILHAIIDYCRELDPGKYIIMKDPNKPVMRIYCVPQEEFDSSGESDEESEGSDSDDKQSD